MRSSSLGRLSQRLLQYSARSFTEAAQNTSAVKKPAGLSTAAKFGIAVPAVATAYWVASSKDPGTRAVIAFQLPVRFARDVICAGLIAAGMSLAHCLSGAECRLLPTPLNVSTLDALWHECEGEMSIIYPKQCSCSIKL